VLGYAANPVGAANTSGGGGSSKGTGVPSPVSPLEGIQQQAAAHGDKVLYADGSSQADAEAVARASDVVIAFASDSEQEGSDRPDLGFRPGVCPFPVCVNVPLDQDTMVKTAAAANPNTVVVIAAGAPVAMPWLQDVRAVVDQWYAGIENGNAIAAVLYGQANPSGKLPQTFPKSLADMPTRTPEQYPGKDGKALYSEGLEIGYRWFDAQRIQPLFPFGYGLSYTSFRYSGLKVKARRNRASVSFAVKNTGSRRGGDVGQVYVGFPRWTGEPPRQLKGFRKVALEPGAAQRVSIALDKRAFSYWDQRRHGWRVGRGCYTIAVGNSSRSLPLRTRIPMRGGRCGR
jgi:beta-glucosidase